MWDSVQPPAPVYEGEASPGPRLGFLGALEASYEAQTRTQSVLGLAHYFERADEDQAAEARKNGIDYTPFGRRTKPDLVGPFTDTYGARGYVNIARTLHDNGEDYFTSDFKTHDDEINALNAKNPSFKLKTMNELYQGQVAEAKRMESRDNLDKSLLGYVGGFVGAAAGSLNINTDPLNIATAPIGGIGKTVFSRLTSQAAGQGAAELVNQLTGVQENRRLLGLDHGVSNAAYSVLGAAAGGAILQGAGEGIAAGVRRYSTGKWFVDAPNDKAPPVPAYEQLPPVESFRERSLLSPAETLDQYLAGKSPLHDSRIGGPRAQADYTVVHNQLSDWGGPRPKDIAPPTETRIPGAEPTTDFKLEYKQGPETLDSIARRVDPEAFQVYDKYAAIKNEARSQLDSMGADRNSNANKAVQDVQDQIDELRQKTDGANRKNAKKYGVRIAELERQRDSFLAVETRTDTPEMAEVRRRLMDADEQMRDMAPAVTRAYASAQNKWTVYESQRQQIAKMIRDGEPGIDHIQPAKTGLPETPPDELFVRRDPVPERATMANEAKPGEALSTTIARLNEKIKEAVDDTLDTFATFAKNATKEVAEVAERETHIELSINGKPYKLPLDGDKISVPLDDGSVAKFTPRELLKEVHNDNQALQAITSCSLNATS